MAFLVDHQASLQALRSKRVEVFSPTTLTAFISNGDDDDDYNDNNNNNKNNVE